MLDPTQYQDWQIAQEAEKGLPPVSYFQEQLGLLPQEIIPYGNTPKLDFMKIMARLSGKPDGKYIEVTAITPTPLGEGKSTTSLGLIEGLGKLGKRVGGCLRQPSGGPTMNVKGSAAGGGNALLIPMTAFSLGLTGDINDISNAHNLAMVALNARMQHERNYDDAALAQRGLKRLDIDPERVQIGFVLDFCAQCLRKIRIGLGEGKMNGYEMDSRADITVSSELAGVLKQTLDISRAHDDLLDITIRPLADVWGIEDGRTEIPSQADIDIALRLVDVSKVSVDGDTLRISEPGMMLDLGAVGKGYGCDMAAEYLKGTDAAGACVALGGSIVVYGSKPDGTAWKVGVKDPRAGAGTTMGVISFGDGETAFVSTSGDYEKYFEQDGRRYHHILDPRTGYPAWNGTIAATVVCDNGLTSDALSTLCMLMDKDKAMKTIQEYGAEAVIIDEDKNVYVSEGLKDRFTITAEDYKLAE